MDNKSDVFFSVIVPAYNVEAYVGRCIESILKQTFSKYEIIVVIDGSKDKSKEICSRYAAKDNRIRVIYQENRGLPGARNTGIKESQGEWLVFVDSDDAISSKSFLTVLYGKIVSGNPDVITYGYKQIREDTKEVVATMYKSMGKMNKFGSKREKLEWCVKTGNLSISAWTHACSKKYIEDHVLYFDEALRTAEDIEWCFRLLSCGPKMMGISGTPYAYMVRSDSICTMEKKTRFWEFREKAMLSAIETIKHTVEDGEYADALFSGLAYHYYIQLGDVESEPEVDARKEALKRLRGFGWLKKYKADKKTNRARFAILVLGDRVGAKVLNAYIRMNAKRKGQPIRKGSTK